MQHLDAILGCEVVWCREHWRCMYNMIPYWWIPIITIVWLIVLFFTLFCSRTLLNISIKCLNVGNDVEQVIKQIFAHQSDYHMYEKQEFKYRYIPIRSAYERAPRSHWHNSKLKIRVRLQWYVHTSIQCICLCVCVRMHTL